MDMKNSYDIWSILDIATDEEGCEFCGQIKKGGLCESCYSAMDSMVYSLCRDMLINEGTIKMAPPKKKEEETQSSREVAISKLLDEFPFAFSRVTSRRHKALMKEGIWFAHLVAYNMVKEIRKDKNYLPFQIILDEVYVMVRNQVFQFLSQGEEGFNEETCDAIRNYYKILDASQDARKIIYYMIVELERSGRIRIDRGKTICSQCGTEIPAGGSNLCKSCSDAEKLNVRRAISTAMPGAVSNDDKPSPIRKLTSSKMHIHSK
ncbi:MAG: hypothetical protein AB1656_00110 [Candidatus Omnitrophota bacterium]